MCSLGCSVLIGCTVVTDVSSDLHWSLGCSVLLIMSTIYSGIDTRPTILASANARRSTECASSPPACILSAQ
ncbi:hypothetical protein B0H11DRAFT_2012130 [Mycena galericulata]|nr:hypothetical protein B0H11DRAFT_2012130 [Mycena galericulata]